MIKLSLESYQTTRHHHILSQPVPFTAHHVANLYFPTSNLTLLLNSFKLCPLVAPSATSKNLPGSNLSKPLKILYTSIKSALRNLVSSDVKFRILNLSNYPRLSSPSIIFVALLCTFPSSHTRSDTLHIITPTPRVMQYNDSTCTRSDRYTDTTCMKSSKE